MTHLHNSPRSKEAGSSDRSMRTVSNNGQSGIDPHLNQEQFRDYIMRLLSDDEEAHVNDHIAECPDCRILVDMAIAAIHDPDRVEHLTKLSPVENRPTCRDDDSGIDCSQPTHLVGNSAIGEQFAIRSKDEFRTLYSPQAIVCHFGQPVYELSSGGTEPKSYSEDQPILAALASSHPSTDKLSTVTIEADAAKGWPEIAEWVVGDISATEHAKLERPSSGEKSQQYNTEQTQRGLVHLGNPDAKNLGERSRGYKRRSVRSTFKQICIFAAGVVAAFCIAIPLIWRRDQGHKKIDYYEMNIGSDSIEVELPNEYRHGVLAIGIDDFPLLGESKRLVTPKQQAMRAAMVAEQYGFANRKNIITLTNGLATEVAVRASLVYLRDSFGKHSDLITIFCATHAEREGSDLRLLMHDSSGELGTGITVKEILEILSPSKARILFVFNVCHGGIVANLGIERPNCWFVTSSQSDKKAYDGSYSGNPHRGVSPFADPWFQSLRGDGDINNDGLVTMLEAFHWTKQQMEESEAFQIPDFHGVRKDFVLSVVDKRLAKRWSKKLGNAPSAPGLLKLKLTEPLSSVDSVTIQLDGIDLGVLRGSYAEMFVSPGKHEINVTGPVLRLIPGVKHEVEIARLAPEYADVDEVQATWTKEITINAGDDCMERVHLTPSGTVKSIQLLDDRKKPESALFPNHEIIGEDNGSVHIDVENGQIEIEFNFLSTAENAAGRMGPVGIEFVKDRAEDITNEDLASPFALQGDDLLELSFQARCESEGTEVYFAVGRPRQVEQKTLSASIPRTFRIEVRADDVTSVDYGFAVSVDPIDTNGRPVRIFLSDVKIQPKRQSSE